MKSKIFKIECFYLILSHYRKFQKIWKIFIIVNFLKNLKKVTIYIQLIIQNILINVKWHKLFNNEKMFRQLKTC